MLAWSPSRPTAALERFSTDRVTSEDGSARGQRRRRSPLPGRGNGDADVLQLDAHALHATESGTTCSGP